MSIIDDASKNASSFFAEGRHPVDFSANRHENRELFLRPTNGRGSEIARTSPARTGHSYQPQPDIETCRKLADGSDEQTGCGSYRRFNWNHTHLETYD